MKNEKKSFVYSMAGKMLCAFICMISLAIAIAAAMNIMYGLNKYGRGVVTSPAEYVKTEAYQSEIAQRINGITDHLEVALTDDNKLAELHLIDVSADELNVYDLSSIYSDDNRGVDTVISYGCEPPFSELNKNYRKSYQKLNMDVTDYSAMRKLLNDKSLEDAYIYFDKNTFRALFMDSGIKNTDYCFSDDFSENSYFVFDYNGVSKKAKTMLADISEMKKQDNSLSFEGIKENIKYNLTSVNFSVYDEESDLYYSTVDDYFDPYDSYIYSIAEVRDYLNEYDSDETRYDSIAIALLRSSNLQGGDWFFNQYYDYASVLDSRNVLKTNYDMDKNNQFYLVLQNGKIYTGNEDVIEELSLDAKEGKSGISSKIIPFLEAEDYKYYIFSLDGKGNLLQQTNCEQLQLCNNVISALNADAKLIVYGYYDGNTKAINGMNLNMQSTKLLYQFFASNMKWFIASFVVMLLLSFVLFIRLIITTGRHYKGDKEIHLYFYDKIPTEIWFCLTVVAGLSVIGIIACSLEGIWISGTDSLAGISDVGMQIEVLSMILGIVVAVGFGFGMSFLLSFVRKIKAHNFWTASLLYKVIHIIKNGGTGKAMQETDEPADTGKPAKMKHIIKSVVSEMWAMIKSCVRSIKGSSRVMILYLVFAIVNIWIVGCAFYSPSVIGISVFTQFIGFCYILTIVNGMNRLTDGVSEIVKGNLDYKIDEKDRLGIYKELTHNINHIGDGLKSAVEQSLKDERMKTELITNVSHDLKTPLTSIINYINLLKSEKMPTKEAEHYIEVLDGKAQRLKQLTDDLVEAAKATSGNIELNMMPITLNELMNQAMGEFEDRFLEKELTIVADYPKHPVKIMADGQRLYRVFENVLQNVYKYAMPKTRVYLDLICKEETVIFMVKNVSEAPLNISADELMERFTRGDSSRTTEGSGLGLSIAKDLTCLQGGTFDIVLDGDLFKVMITFSQLP